MRSEIRACFQQWTNPSFPSRKYSWKPLPVVKWKEMPPNWTFPPKPITIPGLAPLFPAQNLSTESNCALSWSACSTAIKGRPELHRALALISTHSSFSSSIRNLENWQLPLTDERVNPRWSETQHRQRKKKVEKEEYEENLKRWWRGILTWLILFRSGEQRWASWWIRPRRRCKQAVMPSLTHRGNLLKTVVTIWKSF